MEIYRLAARISQIVGINLRTSTSRVCTFINDRNIARKLYSLHANAVRNAFDPFLPNKNTLICSSDINDELMETKDSKYLVAYTVFVPNCCTRA